MIKLLSLLKSFLGFKEKPPRIPETANNHAVVWMTDHSWKRWEKFMEKKRKEAEIEALKSDNTIKK